MGLEPTRTPSWTSCGAWAQIDIEIADERASEPIGTIRIRHGALTAAEIAPDEVPGVIDELPVLAALAAQGGELVVSGAQELRVKESDRIAELAAGLRALGADIDERPDGFHVRAPRLPTGGEADAPGDHRRAMAFTYAARGATARDVSTWAPLTSPTGVLHGA